MIEYLRWAPGIQPGSSSHPKVTVCVFRYSFMSFSEQSGDPANHGKERLGFGQVRIILMITLVLIVCINGKEKYQRKKSLDLQDKVS